MATVSNFQKQEIRKRRLEKTEEIISYVVMGIFINFLIVFLCAGMGFGAAMGAAVGVAGPIVGIWYVIIKPIFIGEK